MIQDGGGGGGIRRQLIDKRDKNEIDNSILSFLNALVLINTLWLDKIMSLVLGNRL